MKKIYAIVLSAALVLLGTQAKAQLSVGAGYLNSTETTTITNSNNSSSAGLNGIYVGGQYNLPIVAGLNIAPGLYLDMLFGGSKSEAAGTVFGIPVSANGSVKYTELALNIPVNLNYTFHVGSDFNVFLYAGPVLQYGLLSKSSANAGASAGAISIGGNKPVETNNYDADNGSRNPFVVYLGGGAGIQAGALQVILGYDHSLTNISKNTNVNLGRSQIKIGVGYSF